MKSLEDRRNVTLLMNPMNISTLQETYPYVPWLEYIRNMLPPSSNVTKIETVVVLDKEFFHGLGQILADTPKRQVRLLSRAQGREM